MNPAGFIVISAIRQVVIGGVPVKILRTENGLQIFSTSEDGEEDKIRTTCIGDYKPGTAQLNLGTKRLYVSPDVSDAFDQYRRWKK